MHATVLLRALGYTTQDLLNYFYDTETVFIDKGDKYGKSVEYDLLAGQRATRDIKVGSEVVVKKNTKFTKLAIKKLKEAKIDRLQVEVEELVGKVAAHDVVDRETGEVILEVNEEVSPEKLQALREANVENFKVLFIDGLNVGSYLRDTLLADKVKTTGGRDHGDLPSSASGRSPDARHGAHPLQQPVLQPGALRPLARSVASS